MSNQRFCIIPARALDAEGLKGSDLKVLCYFGKHADKDGWWRLSQVVMAKSLGIGRTTVFDAIARLIEAQLLEKHVIESRTGRDSAHYYRVVFDIGMPEEGTPKDVLATRAKAASRKVFVEVNNGENEHRIDVENAEKVVVTPAAIPTPPAASGPTPPAASGPTPSITPLTNDPLSRRARKSADGGKPPEREKNCDFEKITKVEKRNLLEAWGYFGKFNGNDKKIFIAFEKLSAPDRLICLEHIRIDAFKAVKKAKGQTYATAFSTYLEVGKFDSDEVETALGRLRVEAAARDKASNAIQLKRFGSAWFAHRLWQLKFGKRDMWKPRAGSTQETLYAKRPDLFADNISEAKWRCLIGFPTRLTDEKQLAGDWQSFVQVAVGSAQWDAWNAWHETNGYPPLEPRRGYEWLWVPVPDPTGMTLDELTRNKNEVAA